MKKVIVLALIVLMLSACGEGGDYVIDLDAHANLSVATVTPETTLPTATSTPAPTETGVPTETPLPTETLPPPTETPAPTQTPTLEPTPDSTTIWLYDESLAAGWSNWSWGTGIDFSYTSLVHSGEYAMQVSYNTTYGGFFPAGTWLDPEGMLSFYAHGGNSSKQLVVQAVDGSYTGLESIVINVPSGTWQRFDVLLSDLSPAGIQIRGLMFMSVNPGIITFDEMKVSQPLPDITPTPTTQPLGEGMIGGNVAWIHYAQDFGGKEGERASNLFLNKNGTLNLTNETTIQGKTVIPAERFAQAVDGGAQRVKWLAFVTDPAWQPEGPPQLLDTDSNGCPDTLDPKIYEDLDAAILMLNYYNLELEWGLFFNPDLYPDTWFAGECATEMTAMFTPLFSEYSGNTTLVGYGIWLEPEWSTRLDDVRNFATLMADAIHNNSDQYAAVESAHLSDLGTWENVPVDILQFSWYGHMAAEDFATATTEQELQQRFGVTQPIMVGEFPADENALSRWGYLTSNYYGAYAWSMFPEATSPNDQLSITWP